MPYFEHKNVFFFQKVTEYGRNSNFFLKKTSLKFVPSFFFFFTKYFLKKGFNVKIASYVHWAFWKLYVSIFQNVEKKKKQYANFFFIFNMLRFNISLFNVNFFFFWLIRLVQYNFFFKISVLPKFLKKKTRDKYLLEPIFLDKKKRLRTSLRIFSLGILKNPAFSFKYRVLNSLTDLAFNFKKSIFFLEKSLMYQKIFKLLKKKKKLK